MNNERKNWLYASVLMLMLLGVSVLGYELGISNINPPECPNVKVEIKSDSALIEVIRGQTKIEMEMLRIIGEQQKNLPVIKNNISVPKNCCKPGIVNSFNSCVRVDSIK